MTVGTWVRVLEIADALRALLPPDEWEELQAMVGETFRVYEIDEYGSAWVKTALVPHEDGYTYNHSLALDPHEKELHHCGLRG